MNDDVRQFVLSKQVKTADECCEFADLFLEMNVVTASGPNNRKPGPWAGGHNALGAAGGQPRNTNNPGLQCGDGATAASNWTGKVRCFECKAIGHKRSVSNYETEHLWGYVQSVTAFTPDISHVMHAPLLCMRRWQWRMMSV